MLCWRAYHQVRLQLCEHCLREWGLHLALFSTKRKCVWFIQVEEGLCLEKFVLEFCDGIFQIHFVQQPFTFFFQKMVTSWGEGDDEELIPNSANGDDIAIHRYEDFWTTMKGTIQLPPSFLCLLVKFYRQTGASTDLVGPRVKKFER